MSSQEEFHLIDRIPCSPELEKSILSCVFAHDSIFPKIAEVLNEQDFFVPHHKTLFKAFLDVWDKNKSINTPLILDHLKSNSLMDKIGGELYILELQETLPVGSIEDVVKKIKEKSTRRRLMELFVSAISKTKEDLPNTTSDLDSIIRKINNINHQSTQEESISIGDACREFLLGLVTRPQQALLTGFNNLDKMTGGFRPQSVIVVAAETSVGKTTFVWQIALNIASKKDPVLYLSLEMSEDEMMCKALSVYSGINYSDILNLNITSDEWKQLEEVSERLEKDFTLRIEGKSRDIGDISRLIRKEVDKYKIKFVVIDHLHFMENKKRFETRNLEITAITADLKALAKELNITILIISQMNRASATRAERRPELSDLRDSGAIEFNADMVMFIYREGLCGNEEVDKNQAEVIVRKNRNGERNVTSYMMFDGATCSFREVEARPINAESPQYTEKQHQAFKRQAYLMKD